MTARQRMYAAWWRIVDELAEGAGTAYWIAFICALMFGAPHLLVGAA